MLLYYPFWMFMGFILHIYIIFGTNLLTEGPTRIAVFFAYFSISKKRNIKRNPNGMKPLGAWFLERTWSRGLGVQVKKRLRQPGDRRACPPPRGAPSCLVGPSGGQRPTSSSYIYPRTPKTSREPTKNNFHHRNLLYPRDLILEPSPALCRRGNRPRRASTSTPLPLRWVVSSLPQTFGSIVIS